MEEELISHGRSIDHCTPTQNTQQELVLLTGAFTNWRSFLAIPILSDAHLQLSFFVCFTTRQNWTPPSPATAVVLRKPLAGPSNPNRQLLQSSVEDGTH